MIFMDFCSFWRFKFTELNIFRAHTIALIADFVRPGSQKLILRKIWVTAKPGNFPHYITQCGKFAVFLSLRFYVKSILLSLKGSEIMILVHFSQKMQRFTKNQNSEPLNVLKRHFLRLKIRQIWFHVKSEKCWNPEVSTLWHANESQ